MSELQTILQFSQLWGFLEEGGLLVRGFVQSYFNAEEE
jgi:hypothetical protein